MIFTAIEQNFGWILLQVKNEGIFVFLLDKIHMITKFWLVAQNSLTFPGIPWSDQRCFITRMIMRKNK